MKLIIDISDKTYEIIKNMVYFYNSQRSGREATKEILTAIKQGTPLPKYHGDLIDRDKLLNTLEKLEWIRTNYSVDEDNTNILEDIINEEPTIIEANY